MAAIAVAASAMLSACGGGSGSGSGSLDPLVADIGIAYVRQPVPMDDDENIRDPSFFQEGSDLFYRDLATPDANERNVTGRVTGGPPRKTSQGRPSYRVTSNKRIG